MSDKKIVQGKIVAAVFCISMFIIFVLIDNSQHMFGLMAYRFISAYTIGRCVGWYTYKIFTHISGKDKLKRTEKSKASAGIDEAIKECSKGTFDHNGVCECCAYPCWKITAKQIIENA